MSLSQAKVNHRCLEIPMVHLWSLSPLLRRGSPFRCIYILTPRTDAMHHLRIPAPTGPSRGIQALAALTAPPGPPNMKPTTTGAATKPNPPRHPANLAVSAAQLLFFAGAGLKSSAATGVAIVGAAAAVGAVIAVPVIAAKSIAAAVSTVSAALLVFAYMAFCHPFVVDQPLWGSSTSPFGP